MAKVKWVPGRFTLHFNIDQCGTWLQMSYKSCNARNGFESIVLTLKNSHAFTKRLKGVLLDIINLIMDCYCF